MRLRAIVQSWTVYPFGCVEILMQKQVLNDEDAVVFQSPHRTSINPDTDIDLQESAVRAHLAAMSFPLEGDGWAQMKQQALLARENPEAQEWLGMRSDAK